MNQTPNLTKITIFTLVSFLFLFSCSSPTIVALTNTQNITAGTAYKYKSETFKRESNKTVGYYVIENEGKTFQEKVSFFEHFAKSEEAEAFQQALSPYIHLYAKSSTAHFVRTSKNANAPNPYRMRANEEVKIISIDETKVEIAGNEGRWIEVITETGFRGYSFDAKLQIIDKIQEKIDQEKLKSNDILLSTLKNKFYPDYYSEMIDENRIDLDEINLSNGFFYNESSNQIILRTQSVYKTFNPDTIVGVSKQTFMDPSIELEIDIINPRQIIISYKERDEIKRYEFFQIDDYETIFTEEDTRRRDNLAQLIDFGGTFTSNSYGTLTINPNGTFVWSDYDRLVPNLIPEGAGISGNISFDLYMARALERKYDDAIYFNFKQGNQLSEIPFFISFFPDKKAIRLISAQKNFITPDNLIERENSSPIIIYFQAGN